MKRRALLLAAALPLAALATPLQDFLDRLVRRDKLPGAVLLVSGPQGREVVTAGVADRRTREPVTGKTRFYIASSGKLVTAAATLQLVQEGRLNLGDKVLPALRPVPGINRLRNIEQVTLEQLLAHRSGLAEYYDDEFESEADAHRDKVFSADESLAFAYGKRPQARPGRQFDYTNTNYVLLGRLVELADRVPYAQAMRQRVFDKVGMPATTVGATGADAAGPLARGYAEDDRGRLQDVSYAGWNAVTGDGAVVTAVADYEAFLHALFRDGKLLPPAVVKRMCTPHADDADSDYGLGCSIEDTRWGEAWGHSGTIPGFNAETWYLPQAKITVVFFTNGDLQDENVLEQAVRAYLRR